MFQICDPAMDKATIQQVTPLKVLWSKDKATPEQWSTLESDYGCGHSRYSPEQAMVYGQTHAEQRQSGKFTAM